MEGKCRAMDLVGRLEENDELQRYWLVVGTQHILEQFESLAHGDGT